jgi:amino acid transporter
MTSPTPGSEDDRLLNKLGYQQELSRKVSGLSNFALSFSIICILSGGPTSFHLAVCASGGASIGIGWPLMGLIAMAVAMTMAQIASAFPTAGGLYHWASILGGRGWGWMTGWLNLAGLVTVIAAVNVGTWEFVVGTVGKFAGASDWYMQTASAPWSQSIAVGLITASQALLNHMGIRLTTRITDLSGFLILITTAVLMAAMIAFSPGLELSRLWTIANHSGSVGNNVWPVSTDLLRVFALGLLLPAYTLTGFDASAHAAEETLGAATAVPKGIVRAVAISGVAGWLMLAVVVASVPDFGAIVASGRKAFPTALHAVLPDHWLVGLGVAIALTMYACGLGTVTSASRMVFAFARDGGLPLSPFFRKVSPFTKAPSHAIWASAVGSWLFTLWTPFYDTITTVCTIFLYLSYVIPIALGAWAMGRSWTRFGPWNLRGWYRPLAIVSVFGCVLVIGIGMQPPNDRSLWVVGGTLLTLGLVWFGGVRAYFAGPPVGPLRPGS